MSSIEVTEILRELIREQRQSLDAFIQDINKEQQEIWKAITRLETKQKLISMLYGAIGSAVPVISAALWLLLRKM